MKKYLFCTLFLMMSGCSSPQAVTAPTTTPIAVAPSPAPTTTTVPTTEAIENPPTSVLTAEAVEPSPTPTLASTPVGKTEIPKQQAKLVSEQSGERINVRDGASVKTYARHYGLAGDKVEVLDQGQDENGAAWYQVKFVQSGAKGWIHGKFVALEGESSPPISEIPASTPIPQVASNQPIREPVSGSCQCPYDTDKRGRSCGARSAYSRPGGATPACYAGE